MIAHFHAQLRMISLPLDCILIVLDIIDKVTWNPIQKLETMLGSSQQGAREKERTQLLKSFSTL
jgi:hypothetical protein